MKPNAWKSRRNRLSLDRHLKGNRITFLKADVEGMEMALLKGHEDYLTTQAELPSLPITTRQMCLYCPPISGKLFQTTISACVTTRRGC